VNLPRSSGLLLHLTSLPSSFGIGDFGQEAYRFVDQMRAAGQSIWQMLPLGPPGKGNSPYQVFSAFAGNPLLISPELLVEDGFLTESDIKPAVSPSTRSVDYNQVAKSKMPLLQKAFERYQSSSVTSSAKELKRFARNNSAWLEDYALFMSLRRAFGADKPWTDWDHDIALRQPKALKRWRKKLANEYDFQVFVQYLFSKQWSRLRDYCRKQGVRLMGDIPIYVSHDSSDVWAHPDLFLLDKCGRPTVVAGVPPDYFSETGQLWGNPIYNWKAMKKDNFAWWTERLRATFAQFDIVRLDHFRGFQAYWAVPASESTAVNGKWVEAPGSQVFRAARAKLGAFEAVAENLGVITPEVEALRKEFHFPGMAVLQFAFGTDSLANSFLPHNYERELFAYTGTHDNDTVVGWWTSTGGDSTRSDEDIAKEKALATRYLAPNGEEINWVLIRWLLSSVAQAAIMTMQDVLGLGEGCRMNTPGTTEGNWKWRMRPKEFTKQMQSKLYDMASVYGRLVEPE
jgi:4-alpha-glucanotransferase